MDEGNPNLPWEQEAYNKTDNYENINYGVYTKQSFFKERIKKELEKVVSTEDPQWVDDPVRNQGTYTLNPDYDALRHREIQSPDNYVKLTNDERSYLRPTVIKT